jgi:hypothetical protein
MSPEEIRKLQPGERVAVIVEVVAVDPPHDSQAYLTSFGAACLVPGTIGVTVEVPAESRSGHPFRIMCPHTALIQPPPLEAPE